MKFKEEVWVTLQVEGIHRWKNCPFDEVFGTSKLGAQTYYYACKKKYP